MCFARHFQATRHGTNISPFARGVKRAKREWLLKGRRAFTRRPPKEELSESRISLTRSSVLRTLSNVEGKSFLNVPE
jgi:hypothetical protein